MITGQIIPTSSLGQQIKKISSLEDVETIIEVGTWNGLGSTRCVLNGFLNKQTTLFLSFEANLEQQQEALVNNKEELIRYPNFRILHGKLVDERCIDDWLNPAILDSQYQAWLLDEKRIMKSAPDLSSLIPKIVDLLILDGGEFASYKEWLFLKGRARYIVLDDTKILKGMKIREDILASKDYEVIEDNLTERNGFLVVKRK